MRSLRTHADTAAITALAFALALLQRPGLASADTKVDLHVDPVGFLAGVGAVWSPTGDLGHVQGGQYAGYLVPMGPWFALGHLAGLAPWFTHRLWLGALLAVAALGTAALVRALMGPEHRVAALGAAAIAVLNPYVVVFAGRTSVTLLAYALMPWLVLAAHRGLRAPRGWWWPAAFALLVTASGAGINAAVAGWMLVPAVALVVFEAATGGAAWRAARAFGVRTVLLVALTSAWWVVPVLVQTLHGTDFLAFTEQPGTIWTTTSASESLRLMGYWTMYAGTGYTGILRPFQADAGTLLFFVPTVAATLLVPAVALGGLLWTRGWRYAPYALGLVLLGVLAVSLGYPEGTPLRRAAHVAYEQVAPLRFLRTTYKAAPLIALGVALLGGAAAGEAWRRLRGAGRVALVGAATALLCLSAWPLVRGQAVDSTLSFESIPAAWRAAADGVDSELAPGTRAVELPGRLFASHTWGGTYDPVLPVLADRPVAGRTIVPYGDLRATELLWTVDALVQQQRLLPGQLPPLLRLMGAGAVVSGADTDRARSGAIGAADAARQLDAALGPPDRSYGKRRSVAAAAGSLAPPARLPHVARRDVPGAPGMVRVHARERPVLLDGSAGALTGLAAVGGLDVRRALLHAADASPAELRRAAEGGAEVVVADGNRRRALAASRLRAVSGPTLVPDDPVVPGTVRLDPFPEAADDVRTVAVLAGGVRHVRAPSSPFGPQFPEHRPFAALDGDGTTSWLADVAVPEDRRRLDVGFPAARDVPWIEVTGHADARGRTTAVRVGGRRWALRPGPNRLPVRLRGVRGLRVRLAKVVDRPDEPAAGGIAELRIPGVRADESLRLPTRLETALRGADLRRAPLSYLFERTTGDVPFRRSPVTGTPQAGLLRDTGDAERGLDRRFSPPVPRAYAADGWATVAPDAPDSALDALAGTAGGVRAESSGRYEGIAGRRASRALDGSPATAWVGLWLPGRPAWLEWSAPRAVSVRALELVPARGALRRPTRVRLVADGRATPPLAVGPGGRVALPAPVRARRFRLEVLAARFPPGTSGADRQRRAVAVAEVRGAGAPAAPEAGGGRAVRAPCGIVAARVGGGVARMRPDATVADLDAGRPLRLRPCGARLALAAGPQRLRSGGGPLRPHLLRLRSPAPAGDAAPVPAGRVLDQGRLGRTELTGARVALDRPAWLVLGQSYARGWRARCDGRDLGAPRPVDAFASGWPAPRDCRRVDFAYAPQRPVALGYAISLPVAIGLLGLLLLRRRPRAEPLAPAPAAPAPEPRPARRPWRRALGPALAAGGALGFVFGIRYAPVVALAAALVLHRGIGVRPLLLTAFALLGLGLPLAYALGRPRDRGGYSSSYAEELIVAHFVAAAALVALTFALARMLSTARARRDGRAPAPATASAPPSPP